MGERQSIEIRRIGIEAALPVRLAALRPGEKFDAVRTPEDDQAMHLGAFEDGRLVSVATLVLAGSEARLRKFGTLPDRQGRGIGARLLAAVIEAAAQAGAKQFWCNARVDAIAIYRRAGMLPVGGTFEQNGRTYQRMALSL